MMQRGVCALSDISWFHRNGYFKDIWPLNSKGKKYIYMNGSIPVDDAPPPLTKKKLCDKSFQTSLQSFFFLFQFSISTLCVSRRPFLRKSLSYKGTCISRSLPHKTFLLQQQKLLFLLDRPPPFHCFISRPRKRSTTERRKETYQENILERKKKKKVLA